MTIGLALALRLSAVFTLPQGTRVTGDSGEYTELALSLLEGRGYTRDLVAPFTPYLGRVPAYPFFIAAVWAVTGPSLFALSLVQSLLDVAVVPMVYAIARLRFNRSAAVIASALYAALPFTIGTAGQVMSEGLCAFLVALAALAHTRAVVAERRGWAWLALSALAWAGAVLARPYLAPVVPLFGLLLAWEVRARMRWAWLRCASRTIAFGLIFAVALSPWLLRNARVAIETASPFVPFQLYGSRPPYTKMYTPGFTRFMASYDEPFLWTDAYRAPKANYLTSTEKARTESLFARIKENEGLVSPEMDAEFSALARERYEAAPVRLYLWRPISMAAKAWFSPRSGALRLTRGVNDSPPRWIHLSFLVINASFSVTALVGLFLLFRTRSQWGNLVFLAVTPVVTTVVAVLVAMRESRLNMPLFPLLCVASALGWAGTAALVKRLARRAAS